MNAESDNSLGRLLYLSSLAVGGIIIPENRPRGRPSTAWDPASNAGIGIQEDGKDGAKFVSWICRPHRNIADAISLAALLEMKIHFMGTQVSAGSHHLHIPSGWAEITKSNHVTALCKAILEGAARIGLDIERNQQSNSV